MNNIQNNLKNLYQEQIEKSSLGFFEKGKRAEVGEVRLWNGQRWVKHADGWIHIHETTGKGTLERPGGKRELASEDHIKHHKEHTSKVDEAENSSIERERFSSDQTQLYSYKLQAIGDEIRTNTGLKRKKLLAKRRELVKELVGDMENQQLIHETSLRKEKDVEGSINLVKDLKLEMRERIEQLSSSLGFTNNLPKDPSIEELSKVLQTLDGESKREKTPIKEKKDYDPLDDDTIKKIARNINLMDIYYKRSDDRKDYSRWENIESRISKVVNQLNEKDKQRVLKLSNPEQSKYFGLV